MLSGAPTHLHQRAVVQAADWDAAVDSGADDGPRRWAETELLIELAQLLDCLHCVKWPIVKCRLHELPGHVEGQAADRFLFELDDDFEVVGLAVRDRAAERHVDAGLELQGQGSPLEATRQGKRSFV